MNSNTMAMRDRRATGGQFDGDVWHLRDGALGIAWSIAAEPTALLHLLTNFLYDRDFAGAYLQLVWGGSADGRPEAPRLRMLLKAFVPRPDVSWTRAARRLLDGTAASTGTRLDRRRVSRHGILDQAEDLEQVALFAGLRPRRLADPLELERLRQAVFGSACNAPDPARGATALAPSPVASVRRYRVEALEDLTPLLTERAGSDGLRALTFVQDRRDDHAAHGWLYSILTAPSASFPALERTWSPMGYRLVPERTLAVSARLFLAPFGPSPALEASLEPCAVRVVLGERPTAPAAKQPPALLGISLSRPTPTLRDVPAEMPWAA